MNTPQVKKVVVGVAIASLIVYCIMGSMTNGESLANPNGIQLAVEILVIISFLAAAILERKSPAPPASAAPSAMSPPAPAPKPAPAAKKK
jgi:hypothetical protein